MDGHIQEDKDEDETDETEETEETHAEDQPMSES
jgi:hypothetical protein